MHSVLGEIGLPIGVPVQILIDLTNGCEQVKSDREEEDAKTNLSRLSLWIRARHPQRALSTERGAAPVQIVGNDRR